VAKVRDARVVRVGLISDTHGLVREEALAALAGSDVIVHAGDVGGPHVIEALARIAPVHAIRGNVDEPAELARKRTKRLDPAWAVELPTSRTLTLAGRRIHVVHALAELAIDVAEEGIDVVVHGHSHVPSIAKRDGVLYVNPGSAGPRRFRLPIAIALLRLGARVEADIVPLTPKP
jgi:putative phosphoesterase